MNGDESTRKERKRKETNQNKIKDKIRKARKERKSTNERKGRQERKGADMKGATRTK